MILIYQNVFAPGILFTRRHHQGARCPQTNSIGVKFSLCPAQAHGSGVESRVQMMMAAMWPYGVCQESGQAPVTEEQLTRRDVSGQLPGHNTGNGGQVIRPRALHRVRSAEILLCDESRGPGKTRLVQFLFLCNPINNDRIIIRMRMS